MLKEIISLCLVGIYSAELIAKAFLVVQLCRSTGLYEASAFVHSIKMPVLLKSALDLSRATLPSRQPELLRLPSSELSVRRFAAERSESGLSTADASSRTIPSVASNGAIIPFPPQHAGVLPRIKALYRRSHLNYLLPLAFMMVYMFIGALLFLWLEGRSDWLRRIEKYNIYQRERFLLLKRMDEIHSDQAADNDTLRRAFFDQAMDHFLSQIGVSFSNESDWSIATALYYSGTVFTTIGYGDVACYTVSGRIATVVYAIIGIPLMLITLNDLGKFLYKAINGLVKLLRESRYIKFLANVASGKNMSLRSLTNNKEEKPDEVEILERGEQHTTSSGRVNFQLSVEGTEDALSLELDQDEGAEPIVEKGPPPRMPVTVALGVTIGWIFFCAGLFKLWEHEWTYAESCYFMFISLSTIGLGDVAVNRRDLMVLCFAFVIIGLSLVSMCINVIQSALEDLYVKILMKILVDYENKLKQGDQMGASVGMIKMWGGNKTAKYLMPLLSKEKRIKAMAKVHDEAEAKGIDIPPEFSDLDENSGMPKIFAINENQSDSALEEAVRQAAVARRASGQSAVTPNVVLYDSDVQTDNPKFDEKAEQTEKASTEEMGVNTEICSAYHSSVEVQCDETNTMDEETQTPTLEMRDKDTATPCSSLSTNETQTEEIVTKEQELQTHLCDYIECDAQTDVIEAKIHWVQTESPEIAEAEVQTDEIGQLPLKSPSRISKARSRIRQVFQRSRDSERGRSADPAMGDWRDPLEEDEREAAGSETESGESLDWDPIDGLHAEKQKPVKDLKRFFEYKQSSSKSKHYSQ